MGLGLDCIQPIRDACHTLSSLRKSCVGVENSTFCSVGENCSADSNVSLQDMGKAFLEENLVNA